MSERLWTVIIDPNTNQVVEALDQSVRGCGMGPNTCGGCIDCIIAQCDETMTIRRDMTDEQLQALDVTVEPETDWLMLGMLLVVAFTFFGCAVETPQEECLEPEPSGICPPSYPLAIAADDDLLWVAEELTDRFGEDLLVLVDEPQEVGLYLQRGEIPDLPFDVPDELALFTFGYLEPYQATLTLSNDFDGDEQTILRIITESVGHRLGANRVRPGLSCIAEARLVIEGACYE